MSESPLTTAVVGLGVFGTRCLEALRSAEALRLVAVGDRDARLAERAGVELGVPSFTDQRQLLSQARPGLLIIATPPSAAGDLVRLGAKSKVHVLKPGPLARTLDEAVSLVKTMDKAESRFAVLSPRRFAPSYRALLAARGALETVFLARAQLVLNWGGLLLWRADQASAGGGVLLEAGYEMIDLALQAMGVPDEVYAVLGRHGRPRMVEAGAEAGPMGLYDTDDTALVTLRYSGGSAASVVASWVSSPAGEQVILHGRRGSAVADLEQCILRDADGQAIGHWEGGAFPVPPLTGQLTELAGALSSGAACYESSAREHLLTMAVVEAAYLSDRTGQPESPLRLLQTRGFTLADCTALRPATS